MRMIADEEGEIWTVLADGYARKPRPVVVVQNDEIEGLTLPWYA